MMNCGFSGENMDFKYDEAKLDQIEANQLVQFLIGLSEPYDIIRSQILVLDPLPNVNKAYSMVLRVERQSQVNMEYAKVSKNSAMQVKGTDYGNNAGQKNFMKKKGTVDKRSMVWDYCSKT
ncbi:hypothetical protein Sango_1603700 [Sesamum angolense]|uniref:Uncharacterized protein n=1 Tax=Sesamum angolense TaxID=2727404 RepID=A0AAE1WJJ7_9LAMI|nr:hypothetical protein Sango_1603700 [Sesamum angolense]